MSKTQEITPELGGRIVKLRKERGLSQREVARRVGIGQQLYNKIERGLIGRTSYLQDILMAVGFYEGARGGSTTGSAQLAEKDKVIPLLRSYEQEGVMYMTDQIIGHLPSDEEVHDGFYGITVVNNEMFPRY